MKKNIPFLFLSVLFCFLGSSCSLPSQFSNITLYFEATDDINDNVLLPVDIVIVDKSLSETVLQIGPDDWFGDVLRDRLVGNEVTHLAFRSSSERNVKIDIPEGVTKVIIYADYENNIDRVGQQIVISPETMNFSPSYTIKIKQNKMELAP